ncbi:MAG TPA: C39 family peptidase [Candidatus Paceibacterota bacterium]|nr:C39 family peptidase [Candidatus Paceibacterota bacterium]
MRAQRVITAVIIIGIAGVLFASRDAIRFRIAEWSKPAVPPAIPRPTLQPSPTSLPDSINLSVPFTSQAPFGVWDADHEDFCEEAAALMAASYLSGDTSITDPAVAEARLQSIKTWELATFGYFRDTTAAETARILTEKLGAMPVQLVRDPTADDLKRFLAAGRLVLVPSAGRLLDNPYFTAPGPVYHMLLLKGYLQDGSFITNDPGTRHGADYVYSSDTIMNAMHDWNGGDVSHGARVVIVVG